MAFATAVSEPLSITRASPFLKWAGGKQQLIPQFEKLFPTSLNRYIEPFLGSGAVFFHLVAHYAPREVILMDINDELVVTYRGIRNNVEKVIGLLEKHKRRHCKAYYLEVRKQRPIQLSQPARAARLIYLNKTCYNGLYRVNSEGQFNVPMGDYKNPQILDPENLRSVSRFLRGVKLKSCSFQKCLEVAERGDFLYMDPPYHPLSKTSNFTSYTKDSFGWADQEKLAKVCHTLHKRGCLVMVSNSNTELICGLYANPPFRINRVSARRTINCKATGRGAIEEVVIRNYGD